MERSFKILTDLPVATQLEVARILAIDEALRSDVDTAFLTALDGAVTNQIYARDENGLIVFASCLGTPVDISIGFKKGALIIQTDIGATTTGLFVNKGDETSAEFLAVTLTTPEE